MLTKIKQSKSEKILLIFLIILAIFAFSSFVLIKNKCLFVEKVKVDKLFLIAPAIAIHSLNYSVKLLSLFPSFVIPSLSPKIYRANYGTPVSAYLSLYKGIKIFEENNIKHVNVKSFIILNENDELVSYKKVKKS